MFHRFASRWSNRVGLTRNFTTTSKSNENFQKLSWVLGGMGLGALTMGAVSHYSYVYAKEILPFDEVPGEEKSYKKKAGEYFSDAIQSFAPLRNIGSHTDGILFLSGEPNRQIETHTLCSWLNNDVAQCLLYDSDKSNARLIGVQYIISERIYKNLPSDEQKLWASKQYEVKDGIVVAPRVPQMAENQLMDDLANTYSKSFCTWQVDKDYLPVGIPQLMFTLTEMGPEPDRKLMEKRMRKLNADPGKLKDSRKNIEAHQVHINADVWKTGETPTLSLTYRKSK